MNKQQEHFTLTWLSTGVTYVQMMIARLSGLLLMFGVIVAMINVLVGGMLLDSLPWLQFAWASVQAVAVDANLPLMWLRCVMALKERDYVKAGIYSICGLLLLVVAFAVTGVESLRSALLLPIPIAASHVHISVELLTELRSIAVVLLLAVSGLDNIPLTPRQKQQHTTELSTIVAIPTIEPTTRSESTTETTASNNGNKKLEVLAYVEQHPTEKNSAVATMFNVPTSTVAYWRNQVTS